MKPIEVPLTNRQLEVLICIAHGQTKKMIARTLGVSIESVREYTKDLYKRLGVNCQAQAVAIATRAGLV
jgi:DNA-binding NarL/FixJ family response regulator